MRLTFFGTSEFALPTLELLRSAGHEIAAVVTQPPRPSGRGRRLRPGPVETRAQDLGLSVLRPEDPNSDGFIARFADIRPELAVLAAYGCILKERLLQIPAAGFINLHPSLLPAYRGAAPVQRCLMAGETRTGVTVIRMVRQVDAGDILDQEPVEIEPDETAGELSVRLAEAGARLVLRTIGQIADNTAKGRAQDPASASRAPRIRKAERLIDWSLPAAEIHNLVRGLSPVPAALTSFRNKPLLVYRTELADFAAGESPGTVLVNRPGLCVAAGSGVILLTEIKPAAGKRQPGTSLRNGLRLQPGERLGD